MTRPLSAGTPAGLARLTASLIPPVTEPDTDVGSRRAAVLIAFLPDRDAAPPGFRLVLVEKSPHLRSHAGQIAFPGGGVDATDASVCAAALREADEEVGIEPSEVTVLGSLPPIQAVTGYQVTPVVGWWAAPRDLVPVDTVEVAAVHIVAVADLIDPASRFTWQHPLGYTGPAFVVGDIFIWGLTAHLLDALLRAAGWEQAWDPGRLTTIPARFDGVRDI